MAINRYNRRDESKLAKLGKALKGSPAQWMVLVNGLVLTFVAYLALCYFINQSTQQDYHRSVSDVARDINERFETLNVSMRMTATIVSEIPDADESTIQSRLVYSLPHLDMMSRMIWFRKTASLGWQIENLYNSQAYSLAAKLQRPPNAALGDAFAAAVDKNTGDISIVTKYPGVAINEEPGERAIVGRDFAIVRPLRRADGTIDSLIVGIVHPSAILSNDWLNQQANLTQIYVRDQLGEIIYSMNVNKAAPSFIAAPDTDNDFPLPLADKSWRVYVGLSQDNSALFLKKISWLLLIFGGSLTLIGTLYIRTNQKQSDRLTAMNQILAKKNYELNSEVAEREKLNESLQNAEREYKAVIDSVSDIIFETNTEGDILFLNSAWERITGFDINDSIDHNIFNLLHDQDQDEQRQNLKDLIRGKRGAYRAFTRLRTGDETFRSVELAISMLRQDENRNTRVVGTFTDVEERYRAERALSEAEKKYQAIVENAAGGIFQITTEGLILSANPAMANILAFDTVEGMLHEVRNAFDYILVAAKDRSRFTREMTGSGTVWNIEVEGKKRNGEKIWLNINARAVKNDDGDILYYEGSMENISQRKATELMLREAKIQSDLASRAKSEFLANMSHELRTPLNSIIGFSEIIKDEVLGPVSNRQYWEYAGDIFNSGRRLLGLINEILDVSRIEAGDRQLNESNVDTVKIIAECLEFVAPRARESDIMLTNLIEGQVPGIIGEELAIKQIMLNLLSNAVKFTPENGRITISYEIDSDGQMLISVTDTGIGLDETEIEKALSPFGQVDSGLNKAGSGTGLGLTLVDSLIKLHGGRLELFSQKGIGTTATVIFPAKRVGVPQDKLADNNSQSPVSEDDTTPKNSIH